MFHFSDPLADTKFDLEKLHATHRTPSKFRRRAVKRCPDCLAAFSTEYTLFNHRISECKPNRTISIVKVARSKKATTTKAKASYDVGGRDYSLARIRMYPCEYCGFKFRYSHNLKQHIPICKKLPEEIENIHNAVRSAQLLTCTSCGTSFSRNYNLHRHQLKSCPALKNSSIV